MCVHNNMKDKDWLAWQKKVIYDEYVKPILEKDGQLEEYEDYKLQEKDYS